MCPRPKAAPRESYARYFVGELFMGTFEGLGVEPEIYWMSELYGDGSMDQFIRAALDRAEVVRDIYLRVSNVERAPGWLPVSVICENCGRIGTTLATDWDGETVAYECKPDYVTWATGCGHSGRVVPAGGRAKLPFNVDWAAKWSHFGITVEGCGKDLGTKGGSRDRSDAISREVFDREPPLNVVYEFLNVGGRKMSTSKGSGAAAHEMADLIPPELIRFLFLRHKPKKALEFDPGGDAIPGLFDEFDRLAAAVDGRPVRGELPADYERIFRLSLVDPRADVAAEAARFRPAFRHLTMLVQVPGRGSRRAHGRREGRAARPGRAGHPRGARRRGQGLARRLGPRPLPGRGARRSARRGGGPDRGAGAVPGRPGRRCRLRASAIGGDAWQDLIYRCGQARGVSSRDAFAAVYSAFLGRTNGPRAGWLLASLEEPFVIERLRAAAAAAAGGRGGRSRRMSVGPVRLREEADVIRHGCIAKGEDPALVDQALVIDEQRRELLGKADSMRAQQKQLSESVGIAIKGGEQPNGPTRLAAQGAVQLDRRRDQRHGRAARGGHGQARGAASAHPQPARPGRARGRRGGQPDRAHLG